MKTSIKKTTAPVIGRIHAADFSLQLPFLAGQNLRILAKSTNDYQEERNRTMFLRYCR